MGSRRSWLPILLLAVVASACSGADDTSQTSVAAATITVGAPETATTVSLPAMPFGTERSLRAGRNSIPTTR